MTSVSENLTFNTNFSNNPEFLADWQQVAASMPSFPVPLYVEQYVNGKSLACPMPLLKLKMALKNVSLGNGVYVTATDPNSTQDIGAFCQHLGYLFTSFTTECNGKIYHIFVQKTV